MVRRSIFTKQVTLAVLASAAWCVLSFAWSYFLISASYESTLEVRLADRTQQIARMLSEHVGLTVSTVDESVLQGLLATETKRDPSLNYLMLWDRNGIVLVHSVEGNANIVLDASKWPPLDDPTAARITRITSAPWDQFPKAGVTDVTVQLPAKFTAYVSAGYSQEWITRRFWQTQQNLLGVALAFAATGVAIIVAAIGLAQRAAQRAKSAQLQTDRARVSLLTERGMLASVLAHEVRSPLTALRFNLHNLRTLLAQPEKNPPRMVELTDSCEREIRRLDLMLNDFLQRTQVVSPPENTPVNQIVNEAIDFLRPTLEQKNIRVILHLDPTNPTVAINADELRQVLLNLAANAQDAMPGGGTLALSTITPDNADDPNVTLIVRDSGTGITSEVQNRLFEPFFSTKPQGSGLGLALVRRVISGAGGNIFVESQPGDGATFRITIPRPALSNSEAAAVSNIVDDDATVDVAVEEGKS